MLHRYDVWMGNSRGNTYSRHHISLSNNDKKYWDFSFHEMAVHDIPAEIDFIYSHRKSELDCANLNKIDLICLLIISPQKFMATLLLIMI